MGNALPPANVCIYTILRSDRLKKAAQAPVPFSFSEGSRWVTAARHLAECRSSGLSLPIVFAAAEATGDLLYFAVIDKITVSPLQLTRQTEVTVSHVTSFSNPKPLKTDLIVDSTGQRLPATYIRPYAICRRPSFLKLP